MNPLDVYGTGQLTPMDALAIINALNINGGSFFLANSAGGTSPLVSATSSSTSATKAVAPVTSTDPQGLYLDVLGTGEVTPQDALQIIDALNTQPAASSTALDVTLQAEDSSGNVLTSVTAGQSFTLVATVQDVRSTPYGVFSAYTDVTYNPSLATISPNANITYGNDFSASESGSTSTAGSILDAGAYDPNTTFPANRNPAEDPGGTYVLWKVPVTVPANATSGTLTFTPTSANADNPSFDTNLYNSTDPEPLADIDYVPASVTVNGVQALPTFSIAPAQASDTTTGASSITFAVTLSQPSTNPLTVTASTANGGSNPAQAGVDYTSTTQTLTFPANNTVEYFTVPIAKATQIQNNKTFLVNLSSPSPSNASALGTSQAVGTILNGDFPTITVPNVSVNEGSGTTPVVFTATLSAPSTQTITVDYATQDGTGAGGAKVITNYGYTAGTLTFLPGQTTATVSVPITNVTNTTGDPPTQNFNLNLFSPVNVTLANSTAVATLNEAPLTNGTITVGPGVGFYSTTGNSTVTFPITLSTPAPTGGVTFNYSTVNGTAIAGTDYVAVSGGVATILAGQTTGSITITTLPEASGTASKTFTLSLSNPTSATLAATSVTGTISNPGVVPTISVSSTPFTDGSTSGAFADPITVSLSSVTGQPVTFSYATANGTAIGGTTLGPGVDYQTTTGTATIQAGQQSVTIYVPVNGQTGYEPNKSFTFSISNITNATLTGGGSTLAATEVINSAFAVPTLSIQSYTGAAGTPFQFVVSLSSPSSQATTVDYATANGTAVAPGAYASASGALTFLPGQTTQILTIQTNPQSLTSSESFTVNLSSPAGATLTTSTATGTIVAYSASTYSGYAFVDPLSGLSPTDAAAKSSYDTALQGVYLTLTGTSSVTGQAVSLSTYTASDGSYSFGNLAPGNYVITEDVPLGFIGTEAVAGGKLVGTNAISFTIPSTGSGAVTNNNFAFSGFAPGGISQRNYLSSTPTGPAIIVSYNTSLQTASVSPDVSAAVTSAGPSASADTTSDGEDPAERLLLAIDAAMAQI